MISAAEICDIKGFSIRKACTFVFLFFAFIGNVFGQDPTTQVPSYEHLNGVNLGTAGAESSENIIISTAVDSQGFIYTLSFGNGVDKLNPDGSMNDDELISSGELQSPLDIEVDSLGKIYIADYFESGSCLDNGKVKIFNSNGNLENEIAYSYFRPLGLAIDNDGHIYIAEYYDGTTCENGEESRIRVFDLNGSYIDETNNVEIPYRLAVNSNFQLFVSQAGNNNPQVLIFDEDLNQSGSLSDITSPGSVFIDEFDFIHVVEYAGRVDFEKFLNYDQLGFLELLGLASNIQQGINNNEFGFKIYNPNQEFEYYYQDSEIRFPVDIAINDLVCDSRLYLNNANINGTSLQFDLEIYDRTPSFDTEDPVANCVGDFDLPLVGSSVSITVDDINNGSTDNCGIESISLSKTTFTEAGDYGVIMTVTDQAGNEDTCTVQVTVTGEDEDTPPEFQNCPSDISVSNDSGQCGAEVNFDIPTVIDDNGNITPTRIDGNTDLNSGDEFPVGRTTITFEANDGVNDPVTCSFDIVVTDNEDPVAICIPPGKEYGLENGTVTITAEEIDNGSYDNCGIASIELARSEFDSPGTHVLSLIVTDTAGNSTICNTNIEIWDEEQTPPEANCKNVEVTLDDNGEASITAVQVYDGNEDLELQIDKENFTCTNLGENEVILTVTDPDTELSNTCTAIITVKDEQDPVVNCVAAGKEFQLQNGSVSIAVSDIELSTSDNCGITTKTLSETTFTTSGTKNITLFVEDEAGNISECSTSIEILPEEETYEFDCIGELTVKLGEDAQNSSVTEIPTSEFITSDILNLDLQLNLQQFTCEDIGVNPLIIRATDKDTGEEYTCTVNVRVEDVGAPLIICPAEKQTRDIPANGIYVLPEVVNLFGISDNCAADEDLLIVQDPPPGTEFTEEGEYEILLTATDPYNNTEICEVIYKLTKTATPTFNCPSENDIEPIIKNENCDYEVPDYRPLITNFQNFNNTPFILPVYEKNNDAVSVTLEVYDGEGGDFIGDCKFEVSAIDETAPVFSDCSNRNLEIMIAEGATWNLQDFRNDFQVSDNCDDNLEITQEPAPGTPIDETTDVTVRVTDDSGNTKSCLFTVKVTIVEGENIVLNCPGEYEVFPNENCEYIVPEFSEILDYAPEGTEITQSFAAGSVIDPNSDPYINITATFENKTETCDIYLILVDEPNFNCPGDKTVNVGEGEDFLIPDYRDELDVSNNCRELEIIQTPTPNTSISEDVEISFEITDAFGNTSTCSFNLDLVTENDLFINCPENKIFDYNEECAFVLPDFRTEAEVNNGAGLEVVQDPLPGTVITDAETEISLSVQNETGIKTCTFLVSLEDNIPPVLNLKDVSINLDLGGSATINFQDIDNGSFDNCDPAVEYTLSRSSFDCKNLGENLVQVIAEDANGNIANGTAIVTVTDSEGVCEGIPVANEYIFVYPNPNIGSFKVATPSDEKIERIEVFDHRGRFITAKDYESTDLEYAMNIGFLQEAVYVLKIVTNQRTLTKRIIFKY